MTLLIGPQAALSSVYLQLKTHYWLMLMLVPLNELWSLS